MRKEYFTPMNIVRSAVVLFLIFYGFFALTNPQMYPVLGKTIQYGNFDPLIGFVMFIVGNYLLVRDDFVIRDEDKLVEE